MSLCIVVLPNALKANEICQKIQDVAIPLAKRELIKPKVLNQSLSVPEAADPILI